MTQPQGALLVGSVNYDDAETTIRTAAALLGGHLKRIPDGEVGKRFHWIMFQPDVLGQAEGIERVGDEPIPFKAGLDARPLRIADGVDAASIVLPPLGYADAAIESYRVFTRLRDEGAVPDGIRFQVSLPTPVAIVASIFSGDDRAAIAPVYTATMKAELEALLDAIPHEDLAVQWDVANEMGIIERAAIHGSTALRCRRGGTATRSTGSWRAWSSWWMPSPPMSRPGCISATATSPSIISWSRRPPPCSCGSRTP